jgi:hypothetical protein
MADWVIKAGDLAPAYEDYLTFEDGTVPSFAGATLEFIMRSGTQTEPMVLGGTVTIVDTSTGAVRFDPATGDTVAGEYMALWRLTRDGKPMSFPTVGYIAVTVEGNPVAESAAQLVSLPEVKGHLGISSSERDHDDDLIRAIEGIRPIIENIAGPIIVTTFSEKHDGGGPIIQVRRRPSSTFGTSPVLELVSATEDWGASTYTLDVVASPASGSTYSCTMDEIGTITRLTGGGGITSFAHGVGNVNITYRAGQAAVPANVRDAALELLRVNWQTTKGRGIGRRTVSDDQPGTVQLGFFVPNRVAEMLSPNRRAPSIA